MTEPGPYIYRKPIGDEVLEHPFRVPMEWAGISVELWSTRRNEWVIVSTLYDYQVWRYRQIDLPPPELLELAEKVRKES